MAILRRRRALKKWTTRIRDADGSGRTTAYRVDLSRVVSKYTGETEKNLGRLFDAAEMPPSSLGGIHLVGLSDGSISVTEAGIVIENGYGARIALVGPVVDVNNGAFTVP